MTDEQLLEAFISRQDTGAFEELVRRHGPMVLRVCQRVLHHQQDAEDAFQATFIVLARKAKAIVKGATASWLYGVAYRIALQTRERRGKHASEQPLDERTGPGVLPGDPCGDREVRQVLYEELDRLPAKYRTPLVLCYLEGKSTQETAEQLGCPKGTVLAWLARGRDRLQSRLARRGLAFTGAALAVVLTQSAAAASVPAGLATGTTKAAVLLAAGKAAGPGVLTAQAGALADAAVRAMFWAKMKLYGLILTSVAAVAIPAYFVLKASDQGLVGHYTFAEAGGLTVQDGSPSRNHGKLVGGVTWTTGHKPGTKALNFDGKTGYVKFDKDLSPWLGGTATVAFWIKTMQKSVKGDSACVTGVDVAGVDVLLNSNDVQWGYLDEPGSIGVCAGDPEYGRRKKNFQEILALSTQPINDGQWHHVGLTRNAALGRLEVYFDGKLSATTLTGATGIKTTPFTSMGRKEVFPEGAKPVLYFQGALDDVRFYKRVLTAVEIEALAK
ncbi:hypothetical protein AYO44_16415 [Planctomycetaceae bacterium SCGC AG-212-F19]|nr:hypothetical protein AYO44_16415 [Planctomycetaceae bacterium SCGC AG-212-F19]